MNPLLGDLLRLRRDRGVRVGLAVTLAVLYVLFVAGGRVGTVTVLASIALGATFVFWRARPMAALLLGALAVAVSGVACLVSFSLVPNLGPYVVVAVPILGAALSDDRRERRGATVLAAAGTVGCACWTWAGSHSHDPAYALLLGPSVAVCLLPLAVGFGWRHPGIRALVVRAVREHLTDAVRTSSRVRLAAGSGIAMYVVVCLAGIWTGDPFVVVTAVPIVVSALLVRRRTQVALALSAVGVALLGVVAAVRFGVSAGAGLLLLVVGTVVFVASIDQTALHRRLAAALVLVVAFFAGIAGGSPFAGLLLLLVGSVPLAAGWGWRWMRTAGHLRVRLTQTQARAEDVEREVLLEQERTRVARDVHDVVAHSLAVVIAQADGARYAAAQNPTTVGPALEAIADTARSALGDVRSLLHELRSSDRGPLPGLGDLDALIDGVRELGLTVQVSTYGEQQQLDDAVGLVLYRVVQEGLTNALRHGDTSEPVDIDFDWAERAVSVVVTNSVEQGAVRGAGDGHGIAGMRERSSLVRGELTAGVGSSGLFRLRVSLPTPVAEPAAAAEPRADLLQQLFPVATGG